MYISPRLPLLVLTLFTPFISSTPLLTTRDASAVQSDLAKIATDLRTLTTAVNGYTGGLTAALQIQTKESAVEDDINKAITDTNAASAFTASESSAITAALVGLEPDIDSSLTALVSKKSLFVSAGVVSIVQLDLNNLKTKTDSLSTALQNKATSTDKATIKSKTAELDAAFDSAIAAYA
ncbi:hypothetical protein P170DRAFT_509323 [Aspergillus steynii IBT 23096]|uniref:Cell wall mannoprotein 1 n=1 Tax=Aspergillus steynii IBT 23096 TaxID=1392250 RepID=A0A2I2GEL1_9EURO|nr:uncharacterized protein P170DRAFT_509323 [Aspergillus steynii IBT 23096]PLB51329.1 hypothetical protein P170DRAFT_509323 [Aspergillus steynii IBT 23096]